MSLHEAAEAAQRSLEDRAARYAEHCQSLYAGKTGWEANDPGEPSSRHGPGSPALPAVVYTLADEEYPDTFPQVADCGLATCLHLTRIVPFAEQGHNHTRLEDCTDLYTQTMPDGSKRKFDPLDYEPGGDPQENVTPPCPAYDAEGSELLVTDDDVARRLSACWNALRGIPTETLEAGSDHIATVVRDWAERNGR